MLFLAAVAKVLPVFLLILLGVVLRLRHFLAPATVRDMKRLVLNVTLPAALFLAFSTVIIEWKYLVIVGTIFAACLAVFLLGRPLNLLTGVRSEYFPPLLTGFEAGMLGYAIFTAVYGAQNISVFGIVDLGQVLFVLLVLIPTLQRRAEGGQTLAATVAGIIRTPVILAVAGGLVFQKLGLVPIFETDPLLDGILQAVRLVGAMTSPLVALAIGYELHFQQGALRRPLITQGVRLLIWIPAGVLFARMVVGGLLGLEPIFQAAILTMVLLPAPFVIPIVMRGSDEAESSYVVNTLTLGTLCTLVAYAVVPVIFPP